MDIPQHIRNICTDYLCGKPVKLIDFDDFLQTCTWDEQAMLLKNSVNSPVIRNLGNLSSAYRCVFLRHLVGSLESNGLDVHDDLYSELAAAHVSNSSEEYAWKHFDLRRSQLPNAVISIRQTRSIISDGTTGLHTWQAAGALAEWAIANVHELCNKQVLELGSGTGLTGLVVWTCCRPSKLMLTDGNERVLELLYSNLQANGVENDKDLTVCPIDWSSFQASDVTVNIVPDIILAADVVYDDTLFVPLCRALDVLFDCPGSENRQAFLAATVRNAETLSQFLHILSELRFNHTEMHVPAPNILYWDDTTPIKIFRITRFSHSTA